MNKIRSNYQLIGELVSSGVPSFNFPNIEKGNLSANNYFTLDLYKVCHYPDSFQFVIEALQDEIQKNKFKFEYLIGSDKDIGPFLSVLAFILGVPFYNLENYPEKILAIHSKKVLLISSYSENLDEAKETIKKEKGEIIGLITIVGKNNSLMIVKDIMDVCLEKGVLDQESFKVIKKSL